MNHLPCKTYPPNKKRICSNSAYECRRNNASGWNQITKTAQMEHDFQWWSWTGTSWSFPSTPSNSGRDFLMSNAQRSPLPGVAYHQSPPTFQLAPPYLQHKHMPSCLADHLRASSESRTCENRSHLSIDGRKSCLDPTWICKRIKQSTWAAKYGCCASRAGGKHNQDRKTRKTSEQGKTSKQRKLEARANVLRLIQA